MERKKLSKKRRAITEAKKLVKEMHLREIKKETRLKKETTAAVKRFLTATRSLNWTPESGFDREKYMRRLDNPQDMSKVHVTVDGKAMEPGIYR